MAMRLQGLEVCGNVVHVSERREEGVSLVGEATWVSAVPLRRVSGVAGIGLQQGVSADQEKRNELHPILL